MTSRVLVYGGKGALGSTIVSHFKAKDWWVGSIDLFANDEASANILVDVKQSWGEQQESIETQASDVLGGEKVDAILCVAGGWAGGNAASNDLVKNSDMMWKQSVWSSVVAAGLATKLLKEGGVLTLPGAHPALKGTPGMIGYGMAKAAVHQLTKSMALPKSGLPDKAFVAAVLPVTLDTPMNRKFMPKADFSTWTPLAALAELFDRWIHDDGRPSNGSLVQVITKDNNTEFIPE